MGTPPKKSSEPQYSMKAPLIPSPSAPLHDDHHDTGMLVPPPPPVLPEAHPLATVVSAHPPTAPSLPHATEEEGAQSVHVDEAARRRAEAMAANRVREERAKAALAEQEAIYQNATMQAALRRADFVGQERDRQGLQALAVDPREHERATPPLDALLPPPVGQAQPRHGDGYRPGEYRIETEGYAVKDYKSIYD